MNYLVTANEPSYGGEMSWVFEELAEAMKHIQDYWTEYGNFQLYKTIPFQVKVSVEIV